MADPEIQSFQLHPQHHRRRPRRRQVCRPHLVGQPGPAASKKSASRDGGSAKIRTRFPPEPNGYLHFGHAKSICLNFGLAQDYGGACHLRFDDTNPEKEEQEYVDSIIDAVKWLGWDWGDNRFFASNYFPWMYEFAEKLIEAGHAYVDSQTRRGDARQSRHADRGRQGFALP